MSSEPNERDAARVLIVDDEQSMREFLGILMRKIGLQFETAESGDEAIASMTDGAEYSLVLTDLKMPGAATGLDVLNRVKQAAPATQVVVMTAYATPETAIEAIKQGAYDYITKPFKVEQARVVIERALEKHALLAENLYLRNALKGQSSFAGMIGSSEPMARVYDLIERVAPTTTTVLIQGESGTGKELVAKAIHERGERNGPFVPVNCGAIPETLIDSELFGFVKGAFTGANADRKGLFESADGGTLFLDEIGELPMQTQVRLLRVLQEHRVKRVGGTREKDVDVRIIAATNRDLREEVAADRFREDLFYRLNVITVDLPPLRQRGEDIRALLEHYVDHYAARVGNDIEGIDRDALRILRAYPYPGNVRELQNIIERAVTLERSDMITTESLPAHLRNESFNRLVETVDFGEEGVDLDEMLSNLERSVILRALDRTGGNKTEAAKLLGITFRSLRYRLDKHELHEE